MPAPTVIIQSRLNGLKDFQKFWKKFGNMPRKFEGKFMEKIAVSLKGRVKRRAPVATGYLKNSVYILRTGKKERLVGVGAFYAKPLEEGARSRYVPAWRSEEHTSELQSHSFISYAVFCL